MDENKDTVHFIITGGTIDSTWRGQKDTVEPSEHSSIPDYLKDLKLYVKFIFTEACMKDSRQLTQDDIKNICKAVEESSCTKIVITHGTYTMPDTARYLKAHLKRTDQVVVLTGSMTPLKGFESTDAPFSLGFAISQVQALSNGVYLCMNGKTFTPEEVSKDLSEGKFYSIFQEEQ
jgi:L-asparaginase